MSETDPIVHRRASDAASGSYVLLTTSPSLGPVNPNSELRSQHPSYRQPSLPPVAHPRYLPILLLFAALDLAFVLGCGLPLAVREDGVWASEAVGLVRVGVVSWVGASKHVAGRKGAVLSMIVLSLLLLVYKINELVQRAPLDPRWRDLLPPVWPPSPLAWFILSFTLSLLHFAAFFAIVGVHQVEQSRRRRQNGGRERRISALYRDEWRGREESVRVPNSPRMRRQGREGDGEEDEDVSDFSAGLHSDETEDEAEEVDDYLDGSDSSEDEHDLIDIPKPGAPSLRHRASRTSWRGPLDEETGAAEQGRSVMTRSFSRRSGLSFRDPTSAEGGAYGSLSIGGI